jgi:hypothetical protein
MRPLYALPATLILVSCSVCAHSAIPAAPAGRQQQDPVLAVANAGVPAPPAPNDAAAELARVNAAIANIRQARADQAKAIDQGVSDLKSSGIGAFAAIVHGASTTVREGIAATNPENPAIKLWNDATDAIESQIKSVMSDSDDERVTGQLGAIGAATGSAPTKTVADAMELSASGDKSRLARAGMVVTLLGDATNLDTLSAVGGIAKSLAEAKEGTDQLMDIPDQVTEMRETGDQSLAMTDKVLAHLEELKASLEAETGAAPADTPPADAPTADAPAADTPAETPAAEAPATDAAAPAADAPAEAPAADAPATDAAAPATDAPAADAPAEAPAADAPATDAAAPATDAPAADAPAEAPAAEAPATDAAAPAADAPAEAPAADAAAPAADAPAETPTADASATDAAAPATDAPAADAPAEAPTADAPAADAPATDAAAPATDAPAADAPAEARRPCAPPDAAAPATDAPAPMRPPKPPPPMPPLRIPCPLQRKRLPPSLLTPPRRLQTTAPLRIPPMPPILQLPRIS